MMKRLLLLISILCTSPTLAQTKPNFSINPFGEAFVRIQYNNNTKVRSLYSLTSSAILTYKDQPINDSIPLGTGQKLLVYHVASPQRGYLSIDNVGATIYLVPNDTLMLTINLNQLNPWETYQFTGYYAPMTQYYFDQAKQFKVVPTLARGQVLNQASSFVKLRQQLDSIQQSDKQFLLTYSQRYQLPAWFVEDELLFIRYTDAHMRVSAVPLRVSLLKRNKQQDVPVTYYSFITPALLNNPSAAHLSEYQRFLGFYLHKLTKAGDSHIEALAQNATKQLSGKAWEIFMTQYIDEVLASQPTIGEKLIERYYTKFKNKKLIDQIKTYYQEAFRLKSGQIAPNFALEDKFDSLATLKDFQGQVVYIGFWFTGCAPCRQEMPLENELVKYFVDKPVKIVSICVLSSREDWVKVSKLYDLQTVNLYANKSWENTLITRYNIKHYPHYVLINQQGQVVKNDCNRPSDGARQVIEALLP